MNKRNLAMAAIVLGVGICAAFGARMTPKTFERTVLAGQAKFLGQTTSQAFDAYCAAREESKLEAGDGCGIDKEEQAKAPAHGHGAPKTRSAGERVYKERLRITSLLRQQTGLPPEINKLRLQWLMAAQNAIGPTERNKDEGFEAPGARVSSWMSDSGLWFVVGLILVLGGCLSMRKLSATPAGAQAEEDRVDLGKSLARMRSQTQELAEMMKGDTPGDDRWEDFKKRIEAILLETVEPVVRARNQIQQELGISTYAAIFSPMSSGERRLNRAWSALVDRHMPEARDSVELAAGDMGEAVDELAAAKSD